MAVEGPLAVKTISFREPTHEQIEDVRVMLQEAQRHSPRVGQGRRQHLVIAHAVSGTIGSITAEVLLFPVDTVKLLVQTCMEDDKAGFFATFFRVLQTKGVAGLYKGIWASVLKESIHSMNFWLFHGLLFKHFAKAADTSKTLLATRLLLNLLAKQLNWVCTVPFEVVSTVNQLAPNSLGFFATAAALYKEGGIWAFYRGLTLSLILAINPAIMNTTITSLLWLTAVYRMRVRGEDYATSRNHGPTVVGAATALAKFLATFGTYPLIRAKVLQQSTQQTNILSIWRNILATEGPRGLYRGVLAMSYKTVCWNALMMMFKHVLGPRRVITPPTTPPHLDPTSLVPPWMGRTPFPAEVITREKLDEILSYVKMDWAPASKVSAIEHKLGRLSEELGEVKRLLRELAEHAAEKAHADGRSSTAER